MKSRLHREVVWWVESNTDVDGTSQSSDAGFLHVCSVDKDRPSKTVRELRPSTFQRPHSAMLIFFKYASFDDLEFDH